MPPGKKGKARGPNGAPDVEAALDDLYTTPPSAFTARRTDLAAEARDAGNEDDARRITGTRRPTLGAWAANLLALSRPEESRQFLELGRALREAHRTLDRAQLKELSARQWRIIAALAAQAVQLAGEAGNRLSTAVQREVESTLRAVLADPDAAERWAAGRLQSTLTPPSTLPGSAVPPDAAPDAAGRPRGRTTGAGPKAATSRQDAAAPAARDDLAERRRAREERLARAREEAKAADDEVRGQRKEVSAAERALERTRSGRERGQRQADAAEERLRQTRADLDQADQDLREAEERHRAAADGLAGAERTARDAAREVERPTGRRKK
ncbi:hypothetical protein K7862_14555 [Streptomyces sp. PLK6-54]|uniref:Transposase n=1 Tax=Actinacidiphila acidipaludis TaxID=2873382 RepID=A0ABS7Q7N8_9ACTN|nr:hypothetical protein [Streptomyces acidipaludis]